MIEISDTTKRSHGLLGPNETEEADHRNVLGRHLGDFGESSLQRGEAEFPSHRTAACQMASCVLSPALVESGGSQ